MVEKSYKKILILEDDAKFSLGFNTILSYFVDEMISKKVEWELL